MRRIADAIRPLVLGQAEIGALLFIRVVTDLRHDRTVLAHIERLVAEEKKLYAKGEVSDGERDRLARIDVELDRCWDLLRQRRALRETGGDPSQAHARPADVVKKYIG